MGKKPAGKEPAGKEPAGTESAGTVQAFRFALDLSPAQVRACRSHAGGSRKAYNFLLARIAAAMAQRDAERTYGVPEEDLTPFVPTSHYALRKLWNEHKDTVAPWWAENSKETYSSAARNLSNAMGAFFDSRAGKRAGRRVGFPRFKGRRDRVGFTFTTGTIRVEGDRRHVTLPRLGRLRTHESTRKLARRLENGTARILSATVTEHGGRWFVSFCVDVARRVPDQRAPLRVIGVDWGVSTLYTGAAPDGAPVLRVANPRHLRAVEHRLRRAQRRMSRRQGPDRRTGQQASQRWLVAQRHVSRLHRHVADARTDLIHKTTTYLAKNYDVIVIEDLNIAGMLRNRHLAKAVSDAAFAEFSRQLGYKTRWYGSRLVTADRYYPSSKTCAQCGAVKAKLSLAERMYHCTTCHAHVDRDVNAATNLARLGVTSPAGSVPAAGRGGPRKTRKAHGPGKAAACETSTSPQHAA